MALGKRIKEKREAIEMTQQQLADKIGKSQSYINSLETRDSKKTDHSEKIAKALGVSHFWLTTGKEIIDHQATISIGGSSPELEGMADSNALKFALGHFVSILEDPILSKTLQDEAFRERVFRKCYEAYDDEDLRALPTKAILRLVS